MGANDIQHGGSHYRVTYQHWDFVADFNLDYYRANATKYMTRHGKKNGRQDMQKAVHYIEKMLELIRERRVPAPICLPHNIRSAAYEVLDQFLAANDVADQTMRMAFAHLVIPEEGVASLTEAGALVTKYMDRVYPAAPAVAVLPPMAKLGDEAGPLKLAGDNPVPSNIAALMEPQFSTEGWWGNMTVLWRCKKCRTFFAGKDGEMPSKYHPSCDPTILAAMQVNAESSATIAATVAEFNEPGAGI